MTRLTALQAARAGYAARATIYRKIKTGELPIESGKNGQAIIDTEDLDRVLGAPIPHHETSPTSLANITETAQLRSENTLLRSENADLRHHRDRLMALLERSSLPTPNRNPLRTLRALLGKRPDPGDPR